MIFCSRCSQGQLDALKRAEILPLTAPSCGLITRTNAEHVVSALVDRTPTKVKAENGVDLKAERAVRVYHDCFGKCRGLYRPSHYSSPGAACIECEDCSGLFAPDKFVCHTHRPKVRLTNHWGFDSHNWRAYILLARDQPDGHKLDVDDTHAERLLLEMKQRYDLHRLMTSKRKAGFELDVKSTSSANSTKPLSNGPDAAESVSFALLHDHGA